jgi:hypothetical protein
MPADHGYMKNPYWGTNYMVTTFASLQGQAELLMQQ